MMNDRVLDNLKNISEKYQAVLGQLMNYKTNNPANNIFSQERMQDIASRVLDKMKDRPDQFAKLNIDYSEKLNVLITNTLMKFIGEEVPSLFAPPKGDKRFKDPAWDENIYFNFLKQFYLMSSELMMNHVSSLGLEPQTQRMAEFLTKQFAGAFCPSNFAISNPEVFKESMSSGWQNIAQGLDNFLSDLKQSDGVFNINTVDKLSFKIGHNIAATPGKVVFQNELMQLIAYSPKEETYEIPILVVPPCINKYYILDLSPENSYIKWMVDNGFQVFLISWVNPDKHLADKDFEDYIKDGIIASCDFIRDKAGYHHMNAVGYCIGGTMLATSLSYMAAKKMDHIKSASFLATLLDFSDPGDIGLFINEETLKTLEEETSYRGYFDGKYLAQSFSLLRANDLIWSFFVNNYLLGKRPLPFDLLYWNSDPTNLPAKMFSFYIRNMYIDNRLTKAGGIRILGEEINLAKIKIPSFFLSCKDDHITLWKPTYKGMQVVGGEKVFCLTASGHVAGVINPPHNRKYSYWVGKNNNLEPEKYLEDSVETQGSWWEYWGEWIKQKSGKIITTTNNKKYKKLGQIEPAPGSYVKVSW
jgi:polyhydroxyalkanoate synthase